MSATHQRPPWLIPTVAMGIFTLLFGGGLVLLGVFFRDLGSDNADPVRRHQRAEEILQSPLPAGFHAALAYRLPGGFAELLILSDTHTVADAEPTFDKQGVWLTKTFGRGHGGVNAYLDDDNVDTGADRGAGYQFENTRRLASGRIESNGVWVGVAQLEGRLRLLTYNENVAAYKFAWGCEQEGVVAIGLWFVGQGSGQAALESEPAAKAAANMQPAHANDSFTTHNELHAMVAALNPCGKRP